jgi:hypothetical protein
MNELDTLEDELHDLEINDLALFRSLKNRAVMAGNWDLVSSFEETIWLITERVNELRSRVKEVRTELGYEDNITSKRHSKISW